MNTEYIDSYYSRTRTDDIRRTPLDGTVLEIHASSELLQLAHELSVKGAIEGHIGEVIGNRLWGRCQEHESLIDGSNVSFQQLQHVPIPPTPRWAPGGRGRWTLTPWRLCGDLFSQMRSKHRARQSRTEIAAVNLL